MKKKGLKKKLSINKQKITKLTSEESDKLRGGTGRVCGVSKTMFNDGGCGDILCHVQ